MAHWSHNELIAFYRKKKGLKMKKLLCFILSLTILLGIPLSAAAREHRYTPLPTWSLTEDTTLPAGIRTAIRNQLGADYRPLLHIADSVNVAGSCMLIVEHKNMLYTLRVDYIAAIPVQGDNGYIVNKSSLKRFFQGSQEPGGWTLAAKKKLPAELAPAYKALLGKSFIPLLYCGSQAVNGTNYSVLCMSRTRVFTVIIHIGPDGKYTELRGQRSIVLTDALLPRR